MKPKKRNRFAIMIIVAILSISATLVPLSEARTNHYRSHLNTGTPTPTSTPAPTLPPTLTLSPPTSTLQPTGQNVITWSGLKWNVRSGGAGSPGTNPWTNQNVWVDNQGRLHLKITNVNGVWYSSEVSTQVPNGYGTYTFDVASSPSEYAKNTVAGMFYYLDDHNEIDFMEYSNWNGAATLNSQSSVHASSGDFQSVAYNTNTANNILTYIWTSSSLVVQHDGVEVWKYTGTIPKLGGVLDINLWLFNNPVPSNGQEQELILNSVQYVPP